MESQVPHAEPFNIALLLARIELVCKDKDAWGPLFNKTSRPRDDDETEHAPACTAHACSVVWRNGFVKEATAKVESLWSDWDIPRRMMQAGIPNNLLATTGVSPQSRLSDGSWGTAHGMRQWQRWLFGSRRKTRRLVSKALRKCRLRRHILVMLSEMRWESTFWKMLEESKCDATVSVE